MSQSLQPFDPVSALFLQTKSAASSMSFGGNSGRDPFFPSFSQSNGPWDLEHMVSRAMHVAISRFQGTNVDWVREAGDLTLSSLVMPAVHWLASVLPEAPLMVVQIDNEGKEKRIPNHPLGTLWARPNPYFSLAQLCDSIALSWIANGNVYFVKIPNALGQPLQLWWVPPYLMAPQWPERPSNIFITHYDYQIEGGFIAYPPERILHFRNMVDHRTLGRTGISPLASGMREIVGDSEWSNYQVALGKRSGVPPFLLSPKTGVGGAGLTTEERKLVREDFDRQRTGDNRGKSMMLSVGMEAKQLGLDPKKLNLSELRYGGQEMIASLTGIPAEILNFGAAARHSSYNNVKEANARAYESVAVPMFRRLEEVLDVQMLPSFYPNAEVPEGIHCRFDRSKIQALQEDRDAYSDRICNEYDKGVIKRKEAKEKLQYTFDDTEDDVYSTDIVKAGVTERINVDDSNPKDKNLSSARRDLAKNEDGKEPGAPAKKTLTTDSIPTESELSNMASSWIQKAPTRARKLYRKKKQR